MIAHAEHQFRLNRPAGDGYTQRTHLEKAASLGDAAAAEQLAGPPLPEAAAYLWGWYGELSATAPATGMGPAFLTAAHIEAWARLRGVRLLPFELDWLLALDERRAADYAERERAAANKAQRGRA